MDIPWPSQPTHAHTPPSPPPPLLNPRTGSTGSTGLAGSTGSTGLASSTSSTGLAGLTAQNAPNILNVLQPFWLHVPEPDMAAKIFATLPKMDFSEALNLLESPDLLKSKIQEAIAVLRAAALIITCSAIHITGRNDP